MDSDSDSDGSHISATPPSSPTPQPPQLQPQPKPLPGIALLSSIKRRTKIVSSSRPILKPKITRKSSRPAPEREEDPPVDEPFRKDPNVNYATLPVQSRSSSSTVDLSSDQNVPFTHMPPGHRTRFALFSKAQNKNLNFEPVESEISSRLKSESIVENTGCQQVKIDNPTPIRSVKRLPNLIGGNISLLPVKRAKCGSEGNFVKLNLNGYGKKKFRFKNKRRSFSTTSARRKYSRTSKKRSKIEGEVEGEESCGVLDEEGLVVETKEREHKLDFDKSLIEEAVARVRNEVTDENLANLLKLVYGYDTFRSGQLEAIKMVLSGKSTMLVLPTGAGKSLCYQLPALVFPGITLVVSPLVALMIDQLKQLPPAIPGGLLSSSQTIEESSETLRLLQEGEIKVLFVSPERFLNAEFVSILSGLARLSLVVVDEAHCISEWLDAGCILAMTATATTKTLKDVMHALGIPPANLIQSAQVRENLHLSVSTSGNRMKDLMTLLKSSPFSEVTSIIIYCKFQSETEILSKYLCDNNIQAKCYHSAIPSKDRRRTQEMFCSNRIRAVVATVAFGMGLDKSDVGAVIHYCLPESLEEYVQEIGRAGRDGRLSYCHLLFDDAIYLKLRSLTYSDGVDEYAVNKFLCEVFASGTTSGGEICSVIKESASRKFDIKEEVMLTILTQLELGEVQYLHLLPQINVTCSVNFYQTRPAELATKDFVVAAILKKSEMRDGQYIFDIPSVSNSIRMRATDLSSHLQSLKLRGEITYELKDQAYCYTIVNVPEDICTLAAQVTKWLSQVENCKVRKIDAMYNAVVSAAKACDKLYGCHDNQHTPCLQRRILEYFNRDDDPGVPNQICQNSPFLRADIKVFLLNNSQAKFTPRAIARILHGLSSPAYPSSTWSRTHFWGRYAQTDFKVIMEAAKAELMNFVGKDVS